jgi:hypothetical protein
LRLHEQTASTLAADRKRRRAEERAVRPPVAHLGRQEQPAAAASPVE